MKMYCNAKIARVNGMWQFCLKDRIQKKTTREVKKNKEKVSNFRFLFLHEKNESKKKNCKFQEYNLSILT